MRKRSSPTQSHRRRGTARTRRSAQTPGPGLRTGMLIPVLAFFLVLPIWSISGAHSTSALYPLQQKLLLQQQRVARPAQAPPLTGLETPVPPDQPTPPRQAGIITAPQTPFSRDLHGAQCLARPVDSKWVIAYAGAQTNPDGTPGRGGLLLYTVGDFALEYVGTFLAPAGTTALTIIQVQGDQLRVQAASGRTLTFHLQSQQYQ